MIAAIDLAQGLRLLTYNTIEFSRFAGPLAGGLADALNETQGEFFMALAANKGIIT